MSFTLHGLGVSAGIAIGRVHILSHAMLEVSHLTIPARAVEKEVARFDKAVDTVRKELDAPRRPLTLHYAWRASGQPGHALRWWLQRLESPATRRALLEQHAGLVL